MRISLLLLSSAILVTVTAAPKSRTKNLPTTVFDQKQTGDYNIQLHLKDFQIIALLTDDTLGSLGDYDYNYDYSDFTIKPANATTVTPNFSSSTPPSEVVEDLSPTPVNIPESSSSSPSLPNKNKIEIIEVSSTKPTTTTTTTTTTANNISNITTEITPNSPDRIKVQIIQGLAEEVPPIAVSEIPLGEVVHYRRCAAGYARDKRGRCRRVRKPSAALPFDFSRLASNLAAKFRQSPDDESATLESIED